ncbi:MAG TPA: hypothetical protein VFD82_12705 [Planctomycetota bacterium]|nr:hypothetical protein [Planctomycetota bacterium]
MRTALFPLAMVLAACNGDDHAAAPPLPTVRITSANALLVARTAVSASLRLADVAGIGVAVITAVPPEPSATFPGTGGGEVVRTWDDRDEDGKVSTGDLFTLAFTAFAEDGLVLDGGMSFDSLVVEGDLVNGLSWLLQARLDFVDLAVTSGSGTETLNGPLWFLREKRATVMTLDLRVGDGLAVAGSELAAGTPFAYHDYVLDFTFAQFGAGMVESEAIGGIVEFETKVPFTGIQFVPDPSVGELEVRGAGGSVLTIRAVDFFNVELALDADGDGVVEQTIPVEWSSL